MKNYGIFYFCNNYVYYLKSIQSEVLRFNLPKNTMNCFRIIKYKNIEKYLGKIFISEKIVNLFSVKKVKVIMPSEYSDCEKDTLRKIFNEYNFNIVEFISEKKLFNDYKNKLYLNIQDSNILIHYKIYNKVITMEVSNYENLSKYIIPLISHKKHSLFVYGSYKKDLMSNNINTYFYDTEIEFLLKRVYKA